MVVAAGVTVADVPVTAPTPWSMPSEVTVPVTVQASSLLPPGWIEAGVAVKALMTGGVSTVTVTAAVAVPAAFVAVRV